ncbi:H+-xyloside symporter [Klebsiella michiganensis]|uniref:H+-xyloside symporter n=1 Tax=Klebsiella michiganensis TaxID=1134687 RepID=A0A7H4N0T9_9ENTR|nr:H+-xyloside symporter [Klebsiella michiganensis]
MRTEGAIYGFFNFITKIAMAIGGGCAGWMLDYYHYDAGNITASAINGINVLMTLFPGAMFALSALFVACYSLDEKTYPRYCAKNQPAQTERALNLREPER